MDGGLWRAENSLLTNIQKYGIKNYQMKEVLSMWEIRDVDGNFVGFIAERSAQRTNILDVLRDADYKVVYLDIRTAMKKLLEN